MRITDIISLQEDVGEAADIRAIAVAVGDFYRKNQDKIKPYLSYTLPEMHQHFGLALPQLRSATTRSMVFGDISGVEPLNFFFNHPSIKSQQAYAAYGDNRINVNAELMDEHKKDIASTVAHEIQHALDDLKSQGKAIAGTVAGDPTKDIEGYLKLPHEINARFMQALMDMVRTNATVEKNKAAAVIAQSFGKYHLTRNLVGDRAYKRLLSRAYKFIDEMNMLAPERRKPGFIDKIKSVIKKLAR
jgi:uncharacterized protein YukE